MRSAQVYFHSAAAPTGCHTLNTHKPGFLNISGPNLSPSGLSPPPPGICCASLKDSKVLMKMGLGLVLVGHVNFLLGALVHGAVYRHITVRVQAPMMVYAISNVIAIVAGLLVS